jgi:hypothetical protein
MSDQLSHAGNVLPEFMHSAIAAQQILQRQRAAAFAISIAVLSSLFANSGAEAVILTKQRKPDAPRLPWSRCA